MSTRNMPLSINFFSNESFCNGLENEFERVVVNEQSVFEPLKFYCKYL